MAKWPKMGIHFQSKQSFCTYLHYITQVHDKKVGTFWFLCEKKQNYPFLDHEKKRQNTFFVACLNKKLFKLSFFQRERKVWLYLQKKERSVFMCSVNWFQTYLYQLWYCLFYCLIVWHTFSSSPIYQADCSHYQALEDETN